MKVNFLRMLPAFDVVLENFRPGVMEALGLGAGALLARHPRLTFQTTGLPVKLSQTPGAILRRPPLHGEHSDEVLGELGVSAEEIADLRRTGLVGPPPACQ